MSDQTIRFSDEERDLVASFLGISTLKVRGVEFLLNLKESERRAEIDALLAEEAAIEQRVRGNHETPHFRPGDDQ